MTNERAKWILERMMLIREFEERLKRLVDAGVPIGAVHLYVGQEAVAAGTCAVLREDDWIASTHRGHGHCIAKGVDVRLMMAELYGKVTGTNRGKGGSMHITDVTKGVLGVNPIVGAGATHAIGAGLSAKIRKTDQVCAAFFGEGAAGIGSLHEAMNMAAIWHLPVLFVCENNGYAQATPVEYAVAIKNIADRAPAYGMPGEIVDGQDAMAVFDAAQRAVQRARLGQGPTLIECKTYRYYGHHQGDNPLRYRTAEEEQVARDRDCIKRFRQDVLSRALMTDDEIVQMEARVKTSIDEAVQFAEASPVPELAELYRHVYVE
jgi:acetoin:2,6-dichlorophenolindophenol oxidoreductase subunit alpha